MKRTTLMFMLLSPLAVLAQRKDFTINGSFASKEINGQMFYLYNERGISVTDSTMVVDGKFTFKGKILGIQNGWFTFKAPGVKGTKQEYRDSRYVYIEPGEFSIEANTTLGDSKVVGSEVNDEYLRYVDYTRPADQKRAELRAKYSALSPEEKKEPTKGLVIKEEIAQTEVVKEKLLAEYIKSHPKSYFSIDAIIKLMGPYVKVEKVDQLWKELDKSLTGSYDGQMINAAIMGSKATEVGSRAPAFAQVDTLGKTVSLSDFKGKYVFVDFWASWCHPCRVENPNVLKAYNAYLSKNFTVVGISIDFEKEHKKWINAIREDKMPWTQLLSPANIDGGAMKSYGIRAIPSNFLIDPNGIIVAKNLHGKELQQKLSELLD